MTLNGNTKSVPSTHAIICNLRPGNSFNGTILAFSKAGNGPSAPFRVSLEVEAMSELQKFYC